jgi:cobalt-zinc-cadmium efflux system membrane fusion protein
MRRFQFIAILIVLGLGVAGGWYVLQQKPAAPTDPHGHGAAGHDGGEKDAHDDHGPGGHEDEVKIVKLTEAAATKAGVTIETAGPSVIRERIEVSGVIQPNQERLMHVNARFAGVVRAAPKKLGDAVAKGDTLVTIESNESLSAYSITASIDGTVIERDAVVGEAVTTEKRLMVVADLDQVWLEFRVFARNFAKVKTGQEVEFSVAQGQPPETGTISFVSPFGSADTQSLLARAVVANQDRRLRPGLFVTGALLLDGTTATVVVKNDALQTVDGKTVVFVKIKDAFEVRAVELGVSDGKMTEVLFGVLAGDRYAGAGSFVMKAELGKSEAAHEH